MYIREEIRLNFPLLRREFRTVVGSRPVNPTEYPVPERDGLSIVDNSTLPALMLSA